MTAPRRLPSITRDTILFASGLAGFAHEMLSTSPVERPYLLVLCGGMMGLPVFLRQDEKDQK